MRTSITISLFFLTSYCAIGQVYLKPYAGINSPSLSADIASFDSKGKVGYQFGADLMFGSSFFFQGGANFESTKLTINNSGELKISRLNIPLYLGFNLTSNENQTFGVRIFAGPNFSISVDKNLDDSLASISKDDFKNAQIGMIGGLGLDLSILFIDVGYKFGLSDVYESSEESLKKHIFFANAGLRIPF